MNPFIRISDLAETTLPNVVSIITHGLDHQNDAILFPIDQKLLKVCFKTFEECTVSITFDKNKVFVLMPFEGVSQEVYEHGIKEAFVELSPADEDLTMPENVCKICKNIQEAGLIVADVSTKNPNVYVELGLAFGLEKRFILLCQDYDDLIFDMRTFNPVKYDPNNLEILKKDLKSAVAGLGL